MAAKLPLHYFMSPKPNSSKTPFSLSRSIIPSLPLSSHHHANLSFILSNQTHKAKIRFLPLSSSSSSSSKPPTSKEEAILQARTSLFTCLEKTLNNPKLAAGKLNKRVKQPRYRVEIPLSDDDSPASLSQLAYKIFSDLPVRRKGSSFKLLIIWPNTSFTEAAVQAFESLKSNRIENVDIASLSDDGQVLNSADVVLFMAPESSQLAMMKAVTESLYPKPVVIFNPRWRAEDENEFGDLLGFVGSFEVIYSFMGLEVQGILSKRKGVIFKCVRDGVLSGERWSVLVEEDDGEVKLVSSFKARPSIDEVETVMYNLMAMNSPITKSAKFLRNLVSSVTGKK